MNQIKWKVCGLRDNISDVLALAPDYAGFVFYQKSPRYVGDDFAMPKMANQNTSKVGVFVNETIDFIYNKISKYQLDFTQLHGSESPEFCEELRKMGVKIIKAFQVDKAFDFELLKKYDLVADYFLFDTKTKQYGGSGKSFDWSVLKNYAMKKKYFLSGGISIDNIGDLQKLDLTKIHAIDVNSKFESSPGSKKIPMLQKLKEQLQELNRVCGQTLNKE